MGSSSIPTMTGHETGSLVGRDYFDSRRAMIDGFVERHFTWPGTFRLHGAALRWDTIAQGRAIAAFPLGQTLGGMWYGVVPVDAAPWLVGATLAGLIMLGSVFAAFAGVLADPVQSWLGIHRRRLGRLLDTLEVDCLGRGDRPFDAREHVFARMLDL